MKVAIQGDEGSACDAAAVELLKSFPSSDPYLYSTDAERTLSALEEGTVEAAVLAMESPVGVPVGETVRALEKHSRVREIASLCCEVRHCLMALPGESLRTIRSVASHQVPLRKHKPFLQSIFSGYEEIETADTGLAAKQLAERRFPHHTAVLALPRAAEVFGLEILLDDLPANDDYLTRFVLVEKERV